MSVDTRGRTYFTVLLTIMFSRSFNGLNFSGIDSHVLRPIITAFFSSATDREAYNKRTNYKMYSDYSIQRKKKMLHGFRTWIACRCCNSLKKCHVASVMKKKYTLL